jgi:hypothetical protein
MVERIVVGLMAIGTGLTLVYLAVQGPLFLNLIRYKTADVITNQLVGQDIVNMFLLAPILLSGGVALLLKRAMAKYLLIMTPLFLIYYALSYTIGWEWSSPDYVGNSVHYTFYFLFVLIASLVILLYTISIFPTNRACRFGRKGLLVYSILFTLFLLVFASMWIKEILDVMQTGTTRGYDLAPTTFWLVRMFDLGFSIPLGLISVYLLWVRPGSTYAIQFLFYGFFFTMIIAVNAMGIMMYIKNDPTFLMRDQMVFLILAGIIFVGFTYIVRGYSKQPTPHTVESGQ